MKGQFKNTKELNTFIEPLKIIGLIVGENGFNVGFCKDENDKIEYSIYAKNKTRGVMIVHKWNSLFDGFEFDGDDTKIGFMRVQDLIGRLSLFDDDIINVEMNDNGILSFKQKKVKLNFKTSDPDLIVDGKRTLKDQEWLAEFDFGDDTEKIISSLKVMSSEEFIFFKGIEEKGTIKITISNSGLKTNALNYSIDATVNADFEIAFKKDILPIILNTKGTTEIKCSIASKMMKIDLKTAYCDTRYYISKALI